MKRTFIGTVAFTSLWFWGLAGGNALARHTSSEIRNKSHLEQVLENEQKKLEIDNSLVINTRYDPKEEFNYIRKIKEKEYEIVFKEWPVSVALIKHELYHLADGHLNYSEDQNIWLRSLRSLFLYEPQTIIYALTGLKL